jgi:threonine/homoserine efflux transporter RhtA
MFFAKGWWSHYLHDWLALMVTGLMLIGIATARGKPLGGIGALAVATGAFGWVYYLTDAGAVFEARSVHVGFGLLFSLGWVALGVGLFAAGGRLAQSPRARR